MTMLQQAEALAEDQYKTGLVDFSNALDDQRSLLFFQEWIPGLICIGIVHKKHNLK